VDVILVDPSLYTSAYDAALTRGLLAIDVQPSWATRPLRPGERQEIPAECTDAFFYGRLDREDRLAGPLRRVLKAWAHVMGVARLVQKVRRRKPQVVHFQWIVVPLVDIMAIALIRRWCPVVLTVHDTIAYNGQKLSWAQQLGYDLPIKLAHRIIVHTHSGRKTLATRGVPDDRITVIPHGPLALSCDIPQRELARDPRWTVVLFGEIKPYKGLDVLIEAVAALAPEVRKQLRVVVAGRPRMEMRALTARIVALGLADQFELRLKHLSEDEMAALFAEADGFVFPYRQIDASGVYYLVKALGKWLIASRVGAFAEEDLAGEGLGTLVPPEDVPALAQALGHAIENRPRGRPAPRSHSWIHIALATRALYERARAEPELGVPAKPRGVWQR
jgi:glycosyltransferase involved in cell wall biosynthesis